MTEAEWLTCADPYLMLVQVRAGDSGWRQRWLGLLGLGCDRARRRLLYLFACGCCRRLWQLLVDQRSRWAVAIGEQYADGLARSKDVRRAGAAALEAAYDAESPRLAHGSWIGAARARAAEAVAGVFDPKEGPVKGALWAREAARAVGKGARSSLVSGQLPPMEIPQQIWYPWDSWSGTKTLNPPSSTTTPNQDRESAAGEAAWQAEGKAQCDLLRDVYGKEFRLPHFNPPWRTSQAVEIAAKMYEEHNFERMLDLAAALQKAGCDDNNVLGHCTEADHIRGCWLVDLVLGKRHSTCSTLPASASKLPSVCL